MRRTLVALCLLAVASGCGGSSMPGDGDGDGDVDGDGDGDGDGDLGSADLQIFSSILAGDIEPAAGLLAITRGGGFPIESEDGFIAARLDDGGGPYRIAGDFNDWTPEPMAAEAGIYWFAMDVAEPDGSLYKLVGPDETYAADPLSRRYGHDEFGEHSLVRATAPHRERWPAMQPSAGGLQARTVRAWVPGDAAAIDRHLFTHDGQNLFEPGAPFGGWRLDETAGPTVLVVGIDNTSDRMSEYTHVADQLGETVGGLGDDYADFIAGDVIDVIEASYGEPAVRGVMGSSLGGLVAFHIAQRHPELFDFAASLSGTFGWGSIGSSDPEADTLIHRFTGAGTQDTVFYLDSGGSEGSGCADTDGDGVNDDGDDSDNYCVTRQLADLLAAEGYEFTTTLHHWWEPDAPHNEAAWAARVFRALEVFEGL